MSLRAVGVVVGHAGSRLRDAVEDAVLAEQSGLGLVATGEHAWEGFVILGALAARTERVELFTTSNWTRTPVTTALAVTTVNELSDGRLRLSLGAMPQAWSEQVHGIAYAQPVARMRDYIGAMRAAFLALPGEPAAHDGPFYTFHGYDRPNRPRPFAEGIYQSVTRPAMTRLAGEIADGVVINLMQSPEWIEGVALPALAEGLAVAGRSRAGIDVAVLRMCAVDDDPRVAYDLLRQGLSYYFNVPYFRDVLEYHGFHDELAAGTAAAARSDTRAMAAACTDRVVDAVGLAGTPAQVRDKLRRYESLVDVVQVMAPLEQTPAVTREQTRRIIAVLAEVETDPRPAPFSRRTR